jgi:tetratricopeptide (TPR) repeat protein
MGLIERKKGNIYGVIKYFKQAISQEPYQHRITFYSNQAFYIEPLASVYYESGDLEAAAEEYKKILSLTLGRHYHGDIYAKAVLYARKNL